MTADKKETSRLLRFYDAYGKRLDVISFALSMICTVLLVFTLTFEILCVQIPFYGSLSVTWIITIFFIFFHGLLTRKLALKEMYAYKILHTERIGAYVLLVSSSVLLSFFLFLLIRSYFFPNLVIPEALSTLLWWVFISFYFLLIVFGSFQLLYRLIPAYVRSRLCFIITLENLHKLHRLGHLERWKCINKYFKWFKAGLRNYDRYIMGEMPSHPQINEIDSYYDSAYLLALTGNTKELKDLESYVKEIHDSLREHDFRHFLISLQHMKGKKTKKETSIYQLSNLFRTVPLSSRIASKGKTIATVLVVTVTLIVGIMEIMKFLGM